MTDDNLILDIDMVLDEPVVKEPEVKVLSKTDLELYYSNIFPFKHFYYWLGTAKSEFFERREFSFTLENDIYVRFQSYPTDEEFKKEVIRGLPIKIDIGAVYNTLPKFHNSVMGDAKGFVPVEKELVFDIDMTDYDDIRTCCKEAKICNKCWVFMIVAYKILNAILTEDFGFEHILWIFSGRRGIHCWVSDERARKLNNDGRSAIANYIKIKTLNSKTGITSTLKEPIHPSIERSIGIIEECFEEYILDGQEILRDEKINEMILSIIKAHFNYLKEYSSTENVIKSILNINTDSRSKWHKIYAELSQNDMKKNTNSLTKAELCFKEIKLNVLFPRLDINVSKHINHLLKSPFCVHPKTGLLSVPMNEKDILNFKITNIPSLKETIEEFMENKKGKFAHFMNNMEEFVKKFLTSTSK